jgi:hypothetical protein
VTVCTQTETDLLGSTSKDGRVFVRRVVESTVDGANAITEVCSLSSLPPSALPRSNAKLTNHRLADMDGPDAHAPNREAVYHYQ